MKVGDPFPVKDGFRIRVTATAQQGESDAELLVQMYEAALDVLPDGQQAQAWYPKYERDSGGRRVGSRRVQSTLLTLPRTDLD